MLVLIGSVALHERYGPLLFRTPRDLDVIGTHDEIQDIINRAEDDFPVVYPIQDGKKIIAQHKRFGPVEFEIAWEGSTAKQLMELVANDPMTLEAERRTVGRMLVPSLDVLYTIKLSHRYLRNSPAFRKTMKDIQAMRFAGAKVPDRYKDWLKAREKETYSYGHPNLNQTKAGFFSGDGVKYVYDHDSIHVAMAVAERPAYTFFQKDGADVAVDRKKWDKLPLCHQLASVLEESYVLALERSQIPFKGQVSPEWSFKKALEKVCTSITSGWWREFAWEHHDQVLEAYDPTYVTRFWQAVETGAVKKL